MMKTIRNEFKMKNLVAYMLAFLTTFLIAGIFYSTNAYADLQSIFYPNSTKKAYGDALNGSGYPNLAYSYWRSETAQGNSNTPTTLRFFNVTTSNGASNPTGAQFGLYKIVDLREKRFLDWYTRTINGTQISVNMDYTANMGSLYTEMTVYADPSGLDGAQMNVRYDRFAYTTN
ncbi:hypothetical protein H70357_02445 [Paenibacillus sp. FSL H7-0357]|uniref:hypothetical protein n=1 Tax=Paenibacillus sp. FSL H7-0357 TaxID=1536774 RepID=UPI0004F62418|nr:hypothetical protein [Paenibacillus sp. FSL H7-0357]AIQ15681.1 hypothetical protein H70357_02445 [Paenibacillus sp. FSL H7-0357]